MRSVPWDLKLLPSLSAYPDFMPAAFPVEVAIIGPEHFLNLAYFHVLPSLCFYYNTC